MRAAYVIFLSSTKDRIFLYLALALCRSIRRFDREHDVIALTANGMVSEEHKGLLRKEGIIVWEEDPLTVPWGRWTPWKYELSKVQVWQHDEYDKLLLLDADCFAQEDPADNFNRPELTCQRGSLSPLNAAKFVLDPSRATYNDMIELIATAEFNERTGWNNAGEFPHWLEEGKMSDWSFNCSTHSQGFLFYYFAIRNKRVDFSGVRHFGHVSGGPRKKLSRIKRPEYSRVYRELGVYEQIVSLPWYDRARTLLAQFQ